MGEDRLKKTKRRLGRALALAAVPGSVLLVLVSACEDASAPGANSNVEHSPEPSDSVVVPAGDFIAGCRARVDSDCLASEEPEGLRSQAAFSIDRTEVTIAAYQTCVDAGACTPPDEGEACNWGVPGRERHPVNCVDWSQAAAFCAWRGARLPTEWEWEKAARGTEGAMNPWGDDPADCSRAVIDEGTGNACGLGDTTFEVGSKPAGASPYGAVDLIGNVWEWTSGALEATSARVVRGGAYYSERPYARASLGLRFKPTGRADFVGFRCAAATDPEA